MEYYEPNYLFENKDHHPLLSSQNERFKKDSNNNPYNNNLT